MKYEEANIVISKKGEKDGKYWIKDTMGEFYGGFRDWEGTLTDGYNQFLNVKEGDNAVVEYSKSVGANDKIYRNVRSIHASSVSPPYAPATSLSGSRGASAASQTGWSNGEPKGDKFWEQQAYEKCQSLWAASMLQGKEGMTPAEVVNFIQMGSFWELFQAIKADGKKRFFDFGKADELHAKEYPEELPTIQQEEPMTYADLQCNVCGNQGVVAEDGHSCIPF